VSLELHLKATIERVWRPFSCEFGLHNCVSLDESWEAADGRHAGC
jgi:hypothetical protein